MRQWLLWISSVQLGGVSRASDESSLAPLAKRESGPHPPIRDPALGISARHRKPLRSGQWLFCSAPLCLLFLVFICWFLAALGLFCCTHTFSSCSAWKCTEVKVAQLCPALCNPMDYPICGILQARILEWVAFPFSRGIFPTQGSNPDLPHCRQIFFFFYQLNHQGSPRILEWVAYPWPADLPDPEINPGSPSLQADSLPAELRGLWSKAWVWAQ